MKAKASRKLSGVIGLRLTPDEEKRITAAANAQGISVSAWLRRMALAAVSCPPDTRFLLAEFMALRAAILTFHADTINGAKLTEAHISETLKQIETKKYAMADSRILAAQQAQTAEKK